MNTVLAAFGLCWMCVAAVLGLVLGVRQEKWMQRLEVLAGSGQLLEYHREHSAFRSGVTVHAHAFLFSVVCICVALLTPHLALAPGLVRALALALMAGTVVWSVGALAKIRAVMGLADLVFLAALLLAAAGLVRAVA